PPHRPGQVMQPPVAVAGREDRGGVPGQLLCRAAVHPAATQGGDVAVPQGMEVGVQWAVHQAHAGLVSLGLKLAEHLEGGCLLLAQGTGLPSNGAVSLPGLLDLLPPPPRRGEWGQEGPLALPAVAEAGPLSWWRRAHPRKSHCLLIISLQRSWRGGISKLGGSQGSRPPPPYSLSRWCRHEEHSHATVQTVETSLRLHADRAAGGDSDHRHPD